MCCKGFLVRIQPILTLKQFYRMNVRKSRKNKILNQILFPTFLVYQSHTSNKIPLLRSKTTICKPKQYSFSQKIFQKIILNNNKELIIHRYGVHFTKLSLHILKQINWLIKTTSKLIKVIPHNIRLRRKIFQLMRKNPCLLRGISHISMVYPSLLMLNLL